LTGPVAVALGCLLLLVASRAAAQSYQPLGSIEYRSLTPVTRPVSTGPSRGVRVGDMRLHPGAAVGGGYDSNVFYEEQQEGIEASPVVQVMPWLRLDTPSPRALRVSANLQLLWELYASGTDAVNAQSGFDALGDVALQIGPRGLISFALYDSIRRFTESPTWPGDETRDHLYNEIGAAVAFHPGGLDRTSRLGFTGALTAGYGREIWPDYLGLDRQMALTDFELKFHFLPKTAAFLRASWDFILYDQVERDILIEDPTPVDEAFIGTQRNIDSRPLRVTGGLGGLLTKALDFRLEGGYGRGDYNEGPAFEGFLALAQLGLHLTPDARLGLSWRRDFSDTSFANYREFDRVSLSLRVTSGDWLVGGTSAFELQRYAELEVPSVSLGGTTVALYNTATREDPVLSGNLFVSWNLTDWSRISSYYRFRANFTDFVITTGRTSGPERPNSAAAQYVKHQIFLMTEFEY
jgi:hypothetical protein